MIRDKGIIEVEAGLADLDEFETALANMEDGQYGYILFDKKKNKLLPQTKYLFGYVLKTISDHLPGHPEPEALYRYFEELYAPIHICHINDEIGDYAYRDIKSEKSSEMTAFIKKVRDHAKTQWNIELEERVALSAPEAQEAYAGAYADVWKNFKR